MTNLQRFKDLLNAAPLRPQDHAGGYGQLWELFRRCFLAPHWPSLLLIALLGAAAAVQPYVYALAGRVIADDIIQVQVLAAEQPAAARLDPTLVGEKRRFAFDDGQTRASLTKRLAVGTGRPVHEKLQLLGLLAVGLAVFLAVIYAAQFVRAQRLIQVGLKVQFRLRQMLHDKLLVLPQTYHDQHSPGRLMTHLFSDVNVIQGEGLRLAARILIDVLTIIVGLAIVLWIDVQMACLVLIAMPAYVVCYRWFRTRLRVVNANLREREGRLNGHIANRIKHFLLVKSFGRETGEAVDFSHQAKPLLRDNLAASVLSNGFSALCTLITGLTVHGVLWLGALRVRDGQMTLGTLLLFYVSAGLLFGPVGTLTNSAGRLHRLAAVASRVMRLLAEPITIDDPPDPRPVPEAAPQVRFERITMRYEADRPPALEDIHFVLPPGRRLCVMGPSGSGRSTLAKLVCRLYDPTAGAVLMDGIDVRHFRICDVRKLVGFVPQESIVFSGSIEQNIRYGSEDADPGAVIGAAESSQLHGFVQQLPHQYQTLTSERGLTLSGGQRQRVNLARALLHDPKVLVLDDCTSALDAQTELQLIEAFRTTLRGRTVVLTTHRVSLAMECDLVLMLDGGRQVEFGPPGRLIDAGGAFAALHELEARRLGIAEA